MPLRILLLTNQFYPVVGGLETIAEILANAFQESGHEVQVVTWSEEKGDEVFPFTIVRNPDLFTLLRLQSWAQIVLENNPCLKLSWPNLFFKRPIVVSYNTWISRQDGTIGWQDKLKISWLRRASAVIASSEVLRDRHFPAAAIIGNPYNADVFKIIPSAYPRTRDRDFVFLGRLVSDKGVDLAVEAMSRIVSSSHNGKYDFRSTQLTIVGDGPEKKRLEAMVTQLGLTKNVTFVGTLRGDELAACLNTHRFMVIPSLWEEPFGIVALEGMACGCLPIASDGGGLPDALGQAGLLFTRGDLSSLTEKMRQVLEDPELRDQLLQHAEKHLQKHRRQAVGEAYLEILEKAYSIR